MKLLLDTHIWIWMLDEPRRLTGHVQQQLQDKSNELWLSPVSTWEVLILHAKKKIQLQLQPDVWVAVATKDFKEAPLTHQIALVSQQLKLHADPGDRFLAATAKVLGLTLVTSDARLLSLTEISTLSNR